MGQRRLAMTAPQDCHSLAAIPCHCWPLAGDFGKHESPWPWGDEGRLLDVPGRPGVDLSPMLRIALEKLREPVGIYR